MKRKLIHLACALLMLSVSSISPVPSAAQVRKRGGTYKKRGSGPTTAPKPDTTLKTDLSFNANMSICFNHEAAIRITRSGKPFTGPFVLSLKVYKGGAVIESMSQTVSPFSSTGETYYFQTQTQMYRLDSSVQFYCQFTIDAQNQISERSENNNVLNQNVPIVNRAHE